MKLWHNYRQVLYTLIISVRKVLFFVTKRLREITERGDKLGTVGFLIPVHGGPHCFGPEVKLSITLWRTWNRGTQLRVARKQRQREYRKKEHRRESGEERGGGRRGEGQDLCS